LRWPGQPNRGSKTQGQHETERKPFKKRQRKSSKILSQLKSIKGKPELIQIMAKAMQGKHHILKKSNRTVWMLKAFPLF